MKIGFVTCSASKLANFFPTLVEPQFLPQEPPFTPDDQIAVDELRKQGYEVEAIVWNSSINSLHDFDLIIVRSPWDYMDNDENKIQFLKWMSAIEKAGLPVVNPAAFILWMLDKHYLKFFADEEVAIIPTQYFAKGASLNLQAEFEKRGQYILKPCVSAAGVGLYHIKTITDALQYQTEVNDAMQKNSYMLQDFIPEILSHGEWSLIFLGGKYSHALHKKPGANSILVHAERGGSLSFMQEPKQQIIEFANRVYEKMFFAFYKATQMNLDPKLILYLRLDIIETKNGPLLIECEGVEPELFFRAKTGSEKIFCETVREILDNC